FTERLGAQRRSVLQSHPMSGQSDSPWNSHKGDHLIIEDEALEQIRNTLKRMTRTYSAGLAPSPGHEHAYRQVNPATPIGHQITLLTTFLNRAYGVVRRDASAMQMPE